MSDECDYLGITAEDVERAFPGLTAPKQASDTSGVEASWRRRMRKLGIKLPQVGTLKPVRQKKPLPGQKELF